MSLYFLCATRALPKDEPNAWTVRFYGQKEQPNRFGQHGPPLALPAEQARWLGPRLAREWRCEVAAVLPCAEIDGPRSYNTLACWRYNQESGDVETVMEWGDTRQRVEEPPLCDGVSREPPESGSASAGA